MAAVLIYSSAQAPLPQIEKPQRKALTPGVELVIPEFCQNVRSAQHKQKIADFSDSLILLVVFEKTAFPSLFSLLLRLSFETNGIHFMQNGIPPSSSAVHASMAK